MLALFVLFCLLSVYKKNYINKYNDEWNFNEGSSDKLV